VVRNEKVPLGVEYGINVTKLVRGTIVTNSARFVMTEDLALV